MFSTLKFDFRNESFRLSLSYYITSGITFVKSYLKVKTFCFKFLDINTPSVVYSLNFILRLLVPKIF